MGTCYRNNANNLAMMRNLPAAAKFIRTSIGGGFWQPGSCPTPIGSQSCPPQPAQQSCNSMECRVPPTRQRRSRTGYFPGTGPYQRNGWQRHGECAPGQRPGCHTHAPHHHHQTPSYAGRGQSSRPSFDSGCGGSGPCGGGCAPSGRCGCYDCRNAYGWASRYWGYGRNVECPSCSPYGGCTGACITPGY